MTQTKFVKTLRSSLRKDIKWVGQRKWLNMRYDECFKNKWTQTLQQVVHQYGMNFSCHFFSHRWSRPSMNPKEAHPDDAQGLKAAVIARIGETMSEQNPQKPSFFWVDYCCIDQDQSLPGIQMLPIYIALCTDMQCFVSTPQYFERAWTRLERAIFAAIKLPVKAINFVHVGTYPKGARHGDMMNVLVDDPTTGAITSQKDLEVVKYLAGFAKTIWNQAYNTWFGNPMMMMNLQMMGGGQWDYNVIGPRLQFGNSQMTVQYLVYDRQ